MGGDGLFLQPVSSKAIGAVGCTIPDSIKSLLASIGEVAFAQILTCAKIDQNAGGRGMVLNLEI